MKRRILIIIMLGVLTSLFWQGKYFYELSLDSGQPNEDFSFTWKQELVDSVGIPEPALNFAINGYHTLLNSRQLKNDSLLAIVDFSAESTKKRFYILDIKNQELLYRTFVAHGKKSGINTAESFSNKRHSNKSSLGLFLTEETYEGNHGYSLRLKGLSEGLNDNARKRAIVIHGADYVCEDFIKRNGRLGRSFGCPALPMEEVKEIIDLIKEGSCLFIYHPSLISISQEDLEKLP